MRASSQNSILVLLFLLMVAFRLLFVFQVHPGNAPDENGHLALTMGLSHGKIWTLQESRAYTYYPYAMANPLSYAPGAIALATYMQFDAKAAALPAPVDEAILYRVSLPARFGQLAWALLYLAFAFLFTARMHFWPRVALLSAWGFLPQLAYVQGYANLDGMGLAVTMFTFWALQRRNPRAMSVALFGIGCSKLNFFCLFPVPLAFFFFEFWNGRLSLKRTMQLVLLPLLLAGTWFVWNYFANVADKSGLLGFSALNQIYGEWPKLNSIFSREFPYHSWLSAFGVFGYMNQTIGTPYLRFWKILTVVFLIAIAFAWKRGETNRFFWRGRRGDSVLALTAFFNVGLHYYASFTTSYQAQGRYIFPAVLIFLAYGIESLSALVPRKRWPLLFSAIAIGMLIACVSGIRVARRNPYLIGFCANPATVAKDPACQAALHDRR